MNELAGLLRSLAECWAVRDAQARRIVELEAQIKKEPKVEQEAGNGRSVSAP